MILSGWRTDGWMEGEDFSSDFLFLGNSGKEVAQVAQYNRICHHRKYRIIHEFSPLKAEIIHGVSGIAPG